MPKPNSRPLSEDFALAAQAVAHRMSGGQGQPFPASPAVMDLVYRGSRAWGLAQVRASRLAKKPPTQDVLALLAIAWAAMEQRLRPIHVVVDEAVAAAKKMSLNTAGKSGAQKIAGFVNALLRRALADQAAAMQDAADPVARWNAPAWWIHRIQADHGPQAAAILDALSSRAPMTLRLCDHQMTVKDYLALLSASGGQGIQVGPRAVVIDPPRPVDDIPGFAEGWVSVQDSAAQHVSEIFLSLSRRLGRPPVILDACAAPGGKSFAIVQSMDCKIWAIDSSEQRLARMQRDWARVGRHAQGILQMQVVDLLQQADWQAVGLPAAFDGILLDAPCSASGVTRRHPEIAWRRRPSDVDNVVDIQRRMLDTLWRRLLPGGELVFVTCSVFAAEGEAQEQAFLARTPGARLMPSPGRLVPISDAGRGRDQDGFFYARFQKIGHAHGPDVAGGMGIDGQPSPAVQRG